MTYEEDVKMSALDIFSQGLETLDDAKKKNQAESSSKTERLRITKDGTYPVRILPLAPIVDSQGNVLPLERKGYEYPTKEIVLKIKSTGKDKDGNDKSRLVNITNARLCFKELQNDLIELYARLVCEKHADDEELCKKIKSGSFNGGLKYDSKRTMYVLDLNERSKGPQLFSLSFAQYKELEERKLQLWAKLIKRGKAPCPISSPKNAFPVEITRKTEAKTSYSYNIDTVSGFDELSDEELQTLLEAPRLPELLYTYTRFHLEACIVFLQQQDELYKINIMEEEAIKDCIEQIKMRLSPDDQTHFTMESKGSSNSQAKATTLADLWEMYDSIDGQGLGDRSEEGQELRTLIREYIEDNNLDIRVDRKKSNLQVLEEMEALKGNNSSKITESAEEEEDDEEPQMPSAEPEEEEEENPRTSRNDDTNEPAIRTRRSARAARRI